MKRRILYGLCSIFLVVLLGGGMVSSLMGKFREMNRARELMDETDHILKDLNISIFRGMLHLESVASDPRRVQRIIDDVEGIRSSLGEMESHFSSEPLVRESCGVCHSNALELLGSLRGSLRTMQEAFSNITMIASLIVTGGSRVDIGKVSEELYLGMDDMQDHLIQIDAILKPMIEHMDNEILTSIARIARTHEITIILTILLVMAAVVVMISAVAYPIRLLNKGTEAIVKGDYDYRIQLEGGDEMAVLAERFNYMAEVLANREKRLHQKKLELEELNNNLERKVRLRTQALREKQEELNRKYLELEAANEELQASYIQLQSATAELEEAQGKLQDNYDVLKVMNEDLQRANEVKNKFLSIMSHELRTPLTVINGYLSLVLDKDYGKPNHELREVLQVVKEQGMNQLGLIEDLLDLTRIESGEFKLYRQAVEPRLLLQKAMDNFRLKTLEKEITLSLESSDGLPKVYWDSQKMLQVFQNLLDNSLKFTPAGGWIAISAVAKSDFVEVTFADNGIGIPKSRLGQIFDRFFQVDSSPTRKYGGSGLGLSIVREIIHAHGGKVFVESEEGKGSNFLLLIPIGEPDRAVNAPQAPSVPDERPAAPAPRGGGERVLVVDDDESFLQMMKKLLPREGYRVRTTSDPGRVVSMTQQQQVDIVLLDLMMPEVDGFEVCRRIRSNDGTRHLPILVVSASGGKEVARKAAEAGADGHITKPFEQQELLYRMAALLREKESFRPNQPETGKAKGADLEASEVD